MTATGPPPAGHRATRSRGTAVSYLARLAVANGLGEGRLLCWVGECGNVPRQLSRRRDGSLNDAALGRLETITGPPAATLQLAGRCGSARRARRDLVFRNLA
jgi:hypothetical protein